MIIGELIIDASYIGNNETIQIDISNHIITFFTIPSPNFTPDHYKIHMYAVNSWASKPEIKVVIFSNELNESMKKSYHRKVNLYDKSLHTGYHGNPLIRDWLVTGQKIADTDYIAFINSDIIITKEWLEVTLKLINMFKEETYIGIARMEVNSYDDSIFKVDYSKIEEEFPKRGIFPNSLGGDLFLFARNQTRFNLSHFPDFEIGYCTWDNFIFSTFRSFPYSISYDYNPRVYHLPHRHNKCTPESIKHDSELIKKGKFAYQYSTSYSLKWWLSYTEGYLYEHANSSNKIYLK